MGFLSNAAKLATGAVQNTNPLGLASGAAYAVTGGRVGVDATPGYSLTNSVRTQVGNLQGNGQSSASGSQPSQGGDAGSQPVYTPPSGSVTGNGAGSGASAADLAYYDDQAGQLRSFLARTGGQLQNGLTQLDYDYNKNANDARENKARTDMKLANQEQDTSMAKDAALERARTGARSLANSVRSIIGRAAGSGSTAFQAGSKAVVDDLSDTTGDIQQTFGRNFRDLAISKDEAASGYDKYIRDLTDERRTKESGLRESVMQEQNKAEGSLADIARQKAAAAGGGYAAVRAASAPLQASIDSRTADIDALFSKFATPYGTQMTQINTPTLADYTQGNTAVQAGQSAGGTSAQVLAPWLRRTDDELAYA